MFIRTLRRLALPGFLIAVAALVPLSARPQVATQTQASPTTRDGTHDFDFLVGSWKEHFKVLRHPMSGSHDWSDFDGTATMRLMWGGKANIEDGVLYRSAGPVDALTLRLYDPKTHQWSIYFGTVKNGLDPIPQVGHFDANGVGTFFGNETIGGKPLVVRYTWTHEKSNTWLFKQAFSADHGKTWETNWISTPIEKTSS
jgi:hypothetical protein